MNEYHIFSQALNIKAPWEISDINLIETETNQSALHIQVQMSDIETRTPANRKTITKRSLNFLGHTCYVHYVIPHSKSDEIVNLQGHPPFS